jgi:plasmid stabilization system protein ParE
VTFRLKPEAEPVIANIALYIAADNPSAARLWLDDIDLRCRNLGETPSQKQFDK